MTRTLLSHHSFVGRRLYRSKALGLVAQMVEGLMGKGLEAPMGKALVVPMGKALVVPMGKALEALMDKALEALKVLEHVAQYRHKGFALLVAVVLLLGAKWVARSSNNRGILCMRKNVY